MIIARRTRRMDQDESGVALIELAAVIPVVLAIGLGVLEFANYFYSYQLVQNGVRDAARFAASLPYTVIPAEVAQQDSWVRNLAVTGVPAGGTSRVSGWTSDQVSVIRDTIPNPDLPGGLRTYNFQGDVPRVTVSTSVPYQSIGFLGFLHISTMSVNASHQERVIGAR